LAGGIPSGITIEDFEKSFLTVHLKSGAHLHNELVFIEYIEYKIVNLTDLIISVSEKY
jgi:transcriptional antiterminator